MKLLLISNKIRQAEREEFAGNSPQQARTLTGKNGAISATASPIAVQSGIEILKKGGSAADAAATIALTQVTTQLGSVVSFAGVMTLIYYDAKSKKVYSLDGGYNSYLHERDSATIPVSDLGGLNSVDPAKAIDLGGKLFDAPAIGGAYGRQTLVPGFMAGIEAMHKKFGKLQFFDLFQPSIYYAEHGVAVNAPLQYYFQTRQTTFARTPEGQQFLRQAGTPLPKLGDVFKQSHLADTLRGVTEHGVKYMYTGTWGRHFLKTVQREGGKICAEDLSRYKPTWSKPLSTEYLQHRVFTVGAPSNAPYHILTALNLAEALKLEQQQNYWQDPAVLCQFQKISDATAGAPWLGDSIRALLKNKAIGYSPASQLTKQYAEALLPIMNQLYGSTSIDNHHSNAIVVVDKDGNIAALTHTINTAIWGGSGIVVDGIPIPDSAGFQQPALSLLKPGDRVPNDMMPTIVFQEAKPILATSTIGMSLSAETLRIIVGTIGKKIDLKTLQEAPPVVCSFLTTEKDISPLEAEVIVPKGLYGEEFMRRLEGLSLNLKILPAATVLGALRGTAAVVEIDPVTEDKHTVETPGVLNFGAAF